MMIADGNMPSGFAGLDTGDDRVLVLTGTTYDDGIDFTVDAEVAIIGDGSQSIIANSTNGLIDTAGNAILYIEGVRIGPNGTADGLTCAGTAVWLDDVEVSGNTAVGLDISSGCTAHLRESAVRSNDGGGIVATASSIFAENSAIVSNGDSFSNLGGVQISDSDVLVTYTTIAANDSQAPERASVYCTGTPTGTIRNSILVGFDAGTISGCGALTLDTNAADSALGGTNSNVGILSATWFDNPGAGDFHLATAGEPVFMDIAMWQDGDPETDFDGDDRPTALPSFPGFDEP
jgi:hypothetical protein